MNCIIDSRQNNKCELHLSIKLNSPESILIQLSFRREDFTFLFGLAVCHLRCSSRLIHPNFNKMHRESVAK